LRSSGSSALRIADFLDGGLDVSLEVRQSDLACIVGELMSEPSPPPAPQSLRTPCIPRKAALY
jgi:hypothetical protein